MPKYILILCTLVLLLSTGCANSEDKVTASLGQEFSLQIGQIARIEHEELEIRFEKVLEDSRCPRDVTCIWAGRVTCMIVLAQPGLSNHITLTEAGLTDKYSKTTYEGYQLEFHVTPYPEAGREIPVDAYKLQLIVTKLQSLTDMLGSVIAAPLSYKGKAITIIGYYRGWDLLQEINMSPPVTRSDWVIKDATGAIYVSANSDAKIPEGLLPSSLETTDTILEIKGVIRVTKEGQPYIDAISIERIH